MIGFLAVLVRFILLAGFTFGFVVLFEHGPANYPDNAVAEWQHFLSFVQERAGAKVLEAPAPAPADSLAPIDTTAPDDATTPADASTPAPAPTNP